MGSPAKKIREYVPIPAVILIALVPVAAIIQIIGNISASFADFFNTKISPVFRGALAYITGWLPFSFAEFLLLAIPIIATAMIIWVVRTVAEDEKKVWRATIALASLVAYLYVSFVFCFALGYKGTSLEDKLEIDRRKVSAAELLTTAEILTETVNSLADEIAFAPDGHSAMPYSYGELNKRLNDAYVSLADKYDFVPALRSNVKEVALSEPWTYTHISGVYTFFTGEANININFPDYTIPFTMAHEMSHQRGIAPEDEANFMAFLVCMESDDAYIRYSGAQNLLEYVSSALYRADKKLYSEWIQTLDGSVRREMAAYNEFFEKYRDNVVADVSTSVNNVYLQSQGTEGTRSYGLVADLAVAYFVTASKDAE